MTDVSLLGLGCVVTVVEVSFFEIILWSLTVMLLLRYMHILPIIHATLFCTYFTGSTNAQQYCSFSFKYFKKRRKKEEIPSAGPSSVLMT